MHWNEEYTKAVEPDLKKIGAYIASPLWDELRAYLEEAYGVLPVVEYSICSGAPGWNVKYKKSGRSLCTLYPAAGYFTCLVTIGNRECVEAELLLPCCTEYVQALYGRSGGVNGARWLMVDVTSPEILADVKALIGTRRKPREGKCHGG